jgi:hypothetical protein
MATPLEFPTPTAVDETFTASNNIVYVWDGQKWTSLGATIVSNENAAVTAAAPSNPVTGTLWYDTVAEHLKVYVNGTWKDARPSS